MPPGTVVGGYILHECVGRGAMAHIYRAEHCVLGREVALKILAPSLMADPAARDRLLREARVTATLKHPNIIDVSDARFHEGNPYVVLDLLNGEDLQSRLQRDGRLPHEETVELGLALASALAAAHARGIVHRDIKPGNVFLARGPDGEIVPKLLDFGICRAPFATSGVDLSATPRDELMGSPLYLSPEGVLGATDLDARSDQYALGVMLYECVTGRPPYLEDTLYSLFQAIASGNIPAPSEFVRDIPPALEQVILRALSRDPAKRFASMQDLGAALLMAGNARTRLIWSLIFGVRDPVLRMTTTSPALSLDRTTKLTRRPRRQPLKAVLAASVTAVPALYALVHVLEPDPYAGRRDEPATHAAWPSAGQTIPFTPPGAVAAPPPRAALEPLPAVPAAAPSEPRPSTLALDATTSRMDVAAPAPTPNVVVAPAPSAEPPTALPPRPAKKAAPPAKPANTRPTGAAAALALVTTPPASLGLAPTRTTPASSVAPPRGQSAAVALGLGSARPVAASSASTSVALEQDEVRKLFFPVRQRPVAATGPAPKRAPSSTERLAR